MDPLGDPLSTCPGQTDREDPIELHPSWWFGCIGNPGRQYGNGLVWTRTWTPSDGPEPLLTLDMIRDQLEFAVIEPHATNKAYIPVKAKLAPSITLHTDSSNGIFNVRMILEIPKYLHFSSLILYPR